MSYSFYQMNISYYSGKVEAYLRYKELPFVKIEASHRVLYNDVYLNTGTMKVPAIKTPEGLWLKDSTAMIQWFEKQYPQHPINPIHDPCLHFFSLLIEDYADEWLWRPSMWWRWMPKASRKHMSYRLATEVLQDLPIPRAIAGEYFAWRQCREWLYQDGMTPDNEHQIRDIYIDQLKALQVILSEQDFLLGSHPSAADYGYFASMYRHFACDPDSGKVMRDTAPAVFAWVGRLWDARQSNMPSEAQWQYPQGDSWQWIIDNVCEVYLPYLSANAHAFKNKQKCFDFKSNYIHLVAAKTHHYRVWCLQQLQVRFKQLNNEQQQQVATLLNHNQSALNILNAPIIDAGLDKDLALPFRARTNIPLRDKVRVWVMGTPRQQS